MEDAMNPPPQLHWGWVLAISCFTGLLFAGIWIIVQSYWVYKVHRRGFAFPLAVVLFLAQVASVFVEPVFVGSDYHQVL